MIRVSRMSDQIGTLGRLLLVVVPCVVVSACTTVRVSPEGQEGASAFLEKREPAFQLK